MGKIHSLDKLCSNTSKARVYGAVGLDVNVNESTLYMK